MILAIMSILTILVYLFYFYLLIGLIFGIWFVFSGVNKLDEGMKDAGWVLRLMLIPGSMGLWPVLINRIRTKHSKSQE